MNKKSDIRVFFAPARLCASVLVLTLTASRALSADSAHVFIWEQANAQAAAAATPAEHLRAANNYNRLVADGVRNGPLFLNLGATLAMAGDGINAAAAFERAERHSGASNDSRRGLRAALALQTGRAHAELSWARTAFFWHYAFPCRVRTWTALAGWGLLWLGVLIRIRQRRRQGHGFMRSLSETCMLTGSLIAAVFAASVLLTMAHERHDSATWDARVFTDVSAGNGEGP